MIHRTNVVGPLQCNCVLLGCEKTKEAVLIDPGDEAPVILKTLQDEGLTLKYILHTHAHFDHVGATGLVRSTCDAQVCLHKGDRALYENLPMQGRLFGFAIDAAPPVEKFLEDEEELTFGQYRIQVLHTPGHSPGGVCFRVLGENEMVFSGDTLFQQSIGRTDLWGGSTDQLLQSIRDRIFTLEGDLPVHPGHGPSTTIGIEKQSNPFLT